MQINLRKRIKDPADKLFQRCGFTSAKRTSIRGFTRRGQTVIAALTEVIVPFIILTIPTCVRDYLSESVLKCFGPTHSSPFLNPSIPPSGGGGVEKVPKKENGEVE